MRKLFAIAPLLLLCLSARAVDQVTALIAVTNAAGTTNGQTITVNGDVRTWTNNVFVSLSQVLTNSTAAGAKTNLYRQIGLSRFSQIETVDAGSTNFQLVGNCGFAVTVAVSPGWATVTYSTQTCANLIGVRVPMSGEPTGGQRTNIASLVVLGIDTLSSNSFHESSIAVINLLGLTNDQTIAGAKIFTNAAGQWFGIVSNSIAISGNIYAVSNGIWYSGILYSPILTNGVNYGSAFRSPGTFLGSEQFGSGALAAAVDAVAIGRSASVVGTAGTALGHGASSLATNAMAIGAGSTAGSDNASAFGTASLATKTNSTAIGAMSSSTHSNSTAIGAYATTTTTNQVRIGTAADTASIPGSLSVIGPIINFNAAGTNNFSLGSDVAFSRFALTTLANGNNAAIPVGTNVFVDVSGPSGAFTINGIAGGRDGKVLILVNLTGQDMTIAYDSGVDPTAANRIYTMTGANRTTTGNGAVMLIYSGSASRWIQIGWDP